jgi:hypothetical protein
LPLCSWRVASALSWLNPISVSFATAAGSTGGGDSPGGKVGFSSRKFLRLSQT